MPFKTRNYRYKAGNSESEKKNFWIFVIVGILIGAAIIYFF